MSALIVSTGEGRYGPAGEEDRVYTTKRFPGSVKPPLIFAHAHKSAVSTMLGPDHYALFHELAKDYTVCVADLGYVSGNPDLWGNDTNVTRVGQVKTFLSDMGATGPVGLVARSHGTLASLTYAHRNPSLVKFVASMTPALSLNSLKQVRSGFYAADINAAYGGTYTDVGQGPTNSPYIYKDTYPADTVPTKFWTIDNDEITLNSFVDGFIATQPAVERRAMGNGDAVTYGFAHADADLFAQMIPEVVSFARRYA